MTELSTRYSSPLLGRPGAVEGEGADAGVAWHYGDPLPEQRRLAAGEALVDLSHRGVVRIAGADRLTWLHSMTTQHLSGLAPGVGAESLLLSPHGHVEHDLHLVDDGESVWIIVEPGTATELVTWLRRMQFMLRLQVDDVSDAWAVLGEVSGDATPPLEGALVWVDPWPELAATGASYSAVADADRPAWTWREVIVPRDRLEEAVGERPLAGTWASEALRLAAWRPRLGFETDHRTIPHEVDWLRTAVHLQKGCYRGQETVARVHNLGRPPRRLVMLHLDGSDHELPPRGTEFAHGGRTVGFVTTSAWHHELGPVALALVRRSLPEDVTLEVAGVAAAQETIVGR